MNLSSPFIQFSPCFCLLLCVCRSLSFSLCLTGVRGLDLSFRSFQTIIRSLRPSYSTDQTNMRATDCFKDITSHWSDQFSHFTLEDLRLKVEHWLIGSEGQPGTTTVRAFHVQDIWMVGQIKPNNYQLFRG